MILWNLFPLLCLQIQPLVIIKRFIRIILSAWKFVPVPPLQVLPVTVVFFWQFPVCDPCPHPNLPSWFARSYFFCGYFLPRVFIMISCSCSSLSTHFPQNSLVNNWLPDWRCSNRCKKEKYGAGTHILGPPGRITWILGSNRPFQSSLPASTCRPFTLGADQSTPVAGAQ